MALHELVSLAWATVAAEHFPRPGWTRRAPCSLSWVEVTLFFGVREGGDNGVLLLKILLEDLVGKGITPAFVNYLVLV
eukprot:6481859-Amphidinium_carterae.1